MAETLFDDIVAVRHGQPIATPGSSLPDELEKTRAAREKTTGHSEKLIVAWVRKMLGAIGSRSEAGEETERLIAAMHAVVTGQALIVTVKPEVPRHRLRSIEKLMAHVGRLGEEVLERRQEDVIEKLVDVFIPDTVPDARGALAADNLEVRDRFLAEVGSLTSAEVWKQSGLKSKNPYVPASRWKNGGEIFSVNHRGTEYFPAFQFRDGRPHPTMKKVLAALPKSLTPWQRAFWFVSTNGWLGNRAPVDVLGDVEAVVAAAEREGEGVIG
jgi:hypothetical protein